MSNGTSPLPAGWSNILDEVYKRLDHAIALADARMTQLPRLDVEALEQGQHQEIAKWSERLQRLSTHLESAEQVVQSVDEALHGEETRLRQRVSASETLRHRLAEGAGGAIG